MEEQEKAYLQMQQDVQDPGKEQDAQTLRLWAQIFKDNGKPELVGVALEKAERVEKAERGE